MAKSDYAIMVEPLSDADGGGWLATVPALPGCMSDGETPEAALADAEAAIKEWQDAARQLSLSQPYKTAVLSLSKHGSRHSATSEKRHSTGSGLR